MTTRLKSGRIVAIPQAQRKPKPELESNLVAGNVSLHFVSHEFHGLEETNFMIIPSKAFCCI